MNTVVCDGASDFTAMLDHPQYSQIASLAKELMDNFVNEKYDKIDLIYHQYKSTSTQILQRKTLLPIDLSQKYVMSLDNWIILLNLLLLSY